MFLADFCICFVCFFLGNTREEICISLNDLKVTLDQTENAVMKLILTEFKKNPYSINSDGIEQKFYE